MRDPQQMQTLENMGVDFMGMIFFPKSPRFVDGEDVCSGCVPKKIAKVGVFVKADLATVVATVKKYNLSYVQLHGGEDIDFANTVFLFMTAKHTPTRRINRLQTVITNRAKRFPFTDEFAATNATVGINRT